MWQIYAPNASPKAHVHLCSLILRVPFLAFAKLTIHSYYRNLWLTFPADSTPIFIRYSLYSEQPRLRCYPVAKIGPPVKWLLEGVRVAKRHSGLCFRSTITATVSTIPQFWRSSIFRDVAWSIHLYRHQDNYDAVQSMCRELSLPKLMKTGLVGRYVVYDGKQRVVHGIGLVVLMSSSYQDTRS